MRSRFVAGAALMLLAASGYAMDFSQQGRDWAMQRDGCGLEHGYSCVTPATEDFVTAASHARMLPGNWLQAWQAAAADFQAIDDLDPAAKQLRHYKFGFAEEPAHYIVLFQALLLPTVEAGEVTGMSRDSIGRTTRYWINKQTFAVEQRLYYK